MIPEVQGQEIKEKITMKDTMCKIRKIINNSAGDCLLSLKFCTDFDHMTFDVPRNFKVNRSKVKATA